MGLFDGKVKEFSEKLSNAFKEYGVAKIQQADSFDVKADPSQSFNKLKGLIIGEVFIDLSNIIAKVSDLESQG